MEVLSIIIPFYDEQSTLRFCVERVIKTQLPTECEILLVNDGSRDNSPQIAAELEREHESVRLINCERNRGKGAAVALGLKEAKGSIAIIQDADLEYNPEDIPRVLQPILDGNADAVYGSRFAASPQRRVLYYRHSLGNRAVTFVSNLLTDLNLTDVETCYKAFRLGLIRDIKIRSRTFTFEIEITAKLAHLGARIYEVPISYHGRSYLEGKKITWRDGIKALFVAIRFWMFSDLGTTHIATRAKLETRKLRRLNKWIASHITPHIRGSVIELGADVGQISSHLSSSEKLTLMEPNVECAEFLRNRFSHRPNVTVINEIRETAKQLSPELERKADTVLASSLIANLSDELPTLKILKSYLNPDGELILLLPNVEMLFSPLDEARGYMGRYSKKSAKEMLEMAGFEVISANSFNRVGSIFWFILGKLFRRKKIASMLLGIFDFFTPAWKLFDYLLPVGGLNLVVRAKSKEAKVKDAKDESKTK